MIVQRNRRRTLDVKLPRCGETWIVAARSSWFTMQAEELISRAKAGEPVMGTMTVIALADSVVNEKGENKYADVLAVVPDMRSLEEQDVQALVEAIRSLDEEPAPAGKSQASPGVDSLSVSALPSAGLTPTTSSAS